MQRATGWIVGLLLASVLLAAIAPRRADAMCCLCRSCPGAAFCLDTLSSSLACATLCLSVSCNSTVFDSVDTCDGGCNGAPVAPTVTVSSTPTVTPTTTPSPSVTVTSSPTATAGLSGRIGYYVGDRPVSGVDVALIAGTTSATTTDANGDYGFTSVGSGMQTLQPTKLGDFNIAITALDATLILQFVDGSEDFSADQVLAGDVTGDGTISTLDATRILQFQSGTLLRLPIAIECGTDWAFRPSPLLIPNQTLVPPQTGGVPPCVKGAIVYGEMFTPPAAGQDFVAILFGDTTGNWMPAP
jgi:hypothetical protein